MTLVIEKNNKADTRMIEYDQAVVRLGLEKAKKITELEDLKKDCVEAEKKKGEVAKEILKKNKELEKITTEILDVIKKGADDAAQLHIKKEKLEKDSTKKSLKLKEISDYVSDLHDKADLRQAEIDMLDEKIDSLNGIIKIKKGEVTGLENTKADLQNDIIALTEVKNEVEEKVKLAEDVLVYIKEKDAFLNRKEADLKRYELRVEKIRKEAGIINEMKFQ